MKPELTVVVPARNASATIGDQLDALLGQQCERPWELIVVDNGSADDTPSIVAQYAERDGRVRLLTANGVRSAAFSRNAGISAARSEAIACCDADDIVAPGWLRAMSEALERAELVAGRIDVHRLNPEWLAATRGTAIERGPGDFMGLCQFAHGANMGVRKSVIERFGGFDEQLPIGEDIELSHRLERGGVRLFYADNAVVFDPKLDKHHHFVDEEDGSIHDVPWEKVQVCNIQSLRGYVIHDYQVVMHGVKKK